jgi:hypothetical protein
VLIGLAAAAVAAVPVGSALAASSGSVAETITVAVRSVTVSPTSVAMCSSSAPLTFPNGTCRASGITITNGSASGHIDVQGANAVPSDNGTNWTPCGSSAGTSCTGTNGPGQDQYATIVNSIGPSGTILSNSPECDYGFDGSTSGCTAASGQSATENINVTGPSASTDSSPTFTSSVTWTAVP